MRAFSRGIAAAIVFAALAVPGSALAGVTTYHPAENARIFADGPGGWQGTSASEGVCLEQLTCPTMTTTWRNSGGTRGGADGFLRTTIENSIAGAESVSRAIWTSPSFEYRGVGGEEPGEVTFEVARRADLTAFNEATGSSASYTAEIINAKTGVGRTIVDDAPLGTIDGWTRTRQIDVKPSSMAIGRDYQIRITATFNTTAKVFRESSVDYDDVFLRAVSGDGAGSSGGSGAGNGNGGTAGNGNGGATVKGKRLFLRLQCLGVARHGKCKVRAVALASKRGSRMTFPIQRRVSAKKGKKVTLRVRPRFVKQLSDAKKVLVRTQVKAGAKRATKFQRFKLTQAR